MIKAVIFDLDGTLVDTERLKGVSYGRAANELRPGTATDEQAIEAFTRRSSAAPGARRDRRCSNVSGWSRRRGRE